MVVGWSVLGKSEASPVVVDQWQWQNARVKVSWRTMRENGRRCAATMTTYRDCAAAPRMVNAVAVAFLRDQAIPIGISPFKSNSPPKTIRTMKPLYHASFNRFGRLTGTKARVGCSSGGSENDWVPLVETVLGSWRDQVVGRRSSPIEAATGRRHGGVSSGGSDDGRRIR